VGTVWLCDVERDPLRTTELPGHGSRPGCAMQVFDAAQTCLPTEINGGLN
jgi:hypothetical protein